MKVRRKIIKIDEEKCDGCGLCIPSCAEGALQIVEGKARLVNEVYCDGLGACLGKCPWEAITIEEREAKAFDEEAVERHLASPFQTCPSSQIMNLLNEKAGSPADDEGAAETVSVLGHWPVKLRLVPSRASFLKGADVVLIADCVPFAFADLHRRFLKDRAVLIGCPKFDEPDLSYQKLKDILREGEINSLTVVHMEVPCCFGYQSLARQALGDSGKELPYREVVTSCQGRLLEEKEKTFQP